jgi:hypothetical protein
LNLNKAKAEKTSSGIKWILLSTFHCVLIVSLFIYVLLNIDEMLYTETMIGKVCDCLVFFSLMFAHLLIVAESYFKQKFLVKFWWHHEKFLRLQRRGMRDNFEKIVFMKVLVLVVMMVIVEWLVIMNIEKDPQWIKFWYVNVFSSCLCRVRHLQQVVFIDAIFFAVKDVNRHLRTVTTWARVSGEEKKFVRRFLYRRVERSEKQLKSLMVMAICVNKTFCWSQVFNFGQNFLDVTSCLYWIYDFAAGPEFLWRE